jgi:hypothetical protein
MSYIFPTILKDCFSSLFIKGFKITAPEKPVYWGKEENTNKGYKECKEATDG